MFDHIEFLFGEALTALRRNRLMTFAAVSTVAVSLFLLGGFSYMYLRVKEYGDTLPGKFEIRVFLRDGLKENNISATAQSFRAIPGVAEVSWIPRDKAWERDSQLNPQLTRDLENPYPDAFKVRLSDLSATDSVISQIKRSPSVIPGSDGVAYLREEQQFVDQSLRFVRWLGGVLGGLLFLTGGALIYNAIRLTVLSRPIEIRIMQLVGASHWTIRIPFLIEGVVQGLLGGITAGLLVYLANDGVAAFLRSLSETMHPSPFPLGMAITVLGVVGAAYGLLCSMFAVHGPLKLR